MKFAQNTSLRITGKILIINLEPQKSKLCDKGHIETEYDMNYMFMCNYCKTRFAHSYNLKEHKEVITLSIQNPDVFMT